MNNQQDSHAPKDFAHSTPENDAEVVACFHQLYTRSTANALSMLYRIQREAYGKSVRDAYYQALTIHLASVKEG